MATELSEIKSNARVELTGDVHITGNIGSGAVITVKDGNLIVDGDVEDGAQIALNQGRRIGKVNFIFDSDHRLASINGSVGSNVTINATTADIKIGGNIGENSQIKTFNGDVCASWDVGRYSKLTTFNGSVRAHNLDEGANAVTFNGRVDVQSAHQSAVLSTFNGDVYVAGVKRPRPQRTTAGSVVVSGGTRFFVNGREITSDTYNTPRESYPGAQLGVVIGLVVGLSITMGIGFAISAPILPFLIATGVVGVACTVIGGLIGHAIQRAMSARSTENPVNPPQQAEQFSGSTTRFQRTMGGSTFTFNNEPGSTVVQQTLGDDAVVTSQVEEQKEDQQRLIKP